ncbi:MAG TPA: hypothetical protein VMI13_06025 [Solirubrobacteraceae bacterium]|nr:hypothetical protein [Solirubrobacteraceae bacterium]
MSVVALALCALAPCAFARSRDEAVTSRYLRANYALVHTADEHVKQIEARLRELVAQIRRECPRVAAGSPKDGHSVELRSEVIGTIVVTVTHLDIPAGEAFLSAVRGLRWSSASLTRAVRGYASKVAHLISLPLPDICADVESWVHSGYTTLPSFTQPFDNEFLACWTTPGFLPVALRRFESPGVRGLVQRTEHDENAIVELESRAVNYLNQILDTIGLH